MSPLIKLLASQLFDKHEGCNKETPFRQLKKVLYSDAMLYVHSRVIFLPSLVNGMVQFEVFFVGIINKIYIS